MTPVPEQQPLMSSPPRAIPRRVYVLPAPLSQPVSIHPSLLLLPVWLLELEV